MHALINNEILSAEMGDNSTINSQFENIQMKINALNLISEKIINKEKNVFSQMRMKPEGYSLSQNYPNPFNPTTKISYGIPKEGFVTLKIYDILGKEVMTLVNGNMQAGYYDAEFSGNNLASGLYFYKLESGSFKETKRMLLIK